MTPGAAAFAVIIALVACETERGSPPPPTPAPLPSESPSTAPQKPSRDARPIPQAPSPSASAIPEAGLSADLEARRAQLELKAKSANDMKAIRELGKLCKKLGDQPCLRRVASYQARYVYEHMER